MYFQDIKLLGLKKKERKKKSIYSIRQEKKGDSGYRAQYLRLWRALTPRATRATEIPLRTDGWTNTDVDIMRIGYKANTPRELRL